MVVKEKEKILEAINKTINEKGLIFLRHHNDGDGYSAGLIAETILRKLTNLNRKQISFFSYNYTSISWYLSLLFFKSLYLFLEFFNFFF